MPDLTQDLMLRLELAALQDRYVAALDNDRIEEWPGLFTDDCLYEIVSKENEDQGLPAPLMHCDGIRMLRDRIVSLRHANIYEKPVAAGLTLVFGVMDFINLAHGVQYMLGAYIAASLGVWAGSFWIGLALALPAAATLGLLLEVLVFGHLYGRPAGHPGPGDAAGPAAAGDGGVVGPADRGGAGVHAGVHRHGGDPVRASRRAVPGAPGWTWSG